MKFLAALLCLPVLALAAGEADPTPALADHQEGARKLADQQDELAADVQQLVIEQTQAKVIELLESVEDAMDEATTLLADSDTGGPTIAAQTDVIEKILAAAEQKQQQQGDGDGSGGAMLDMMREMAGKGKAGGQPGQGPGQQGGEGRTGASDSTNSANGGPNGGKSAERRVPKASGSAGQSLPPEFQPALDAYNRAAEQLAK
jgi:hypothetical protein